MRTNIVEVRESYSLFNNELNDEIEYMEKFYKIIDIKFSTFYDRF